MVKIMKLTENHQSNVNLNGNRPNIVWVFLDQCRADVLHCYGHPFIETPNIDSMAERGVLFANAYSQAPVCVPARVSMVSGRYPHQTGVYENHQSMVPEDSLLLRTFREFGYKTANVGKVHLGIEPSEAGFDEHRDIPKKPSNAPDGYPDGWPWRRFEVEGFPRPVIFGTDTGSCDRTYSAIGVHHSIDIFSNHSFNNGPFMLRLSLDQPHTPVTPPQPYDRMYASRTSVPRRRSSKFPPYRSDKLTLSLAQRCIARSADSLALLEIL